MKINKTTKTIGIILVIAVLLLMAFNYTGLSLPKAITGSSTLSLTQASLQSSNPYLNGKAWLLTFTSGGLGQSYYGTVTPSDVDAQTPDKTTTTKSLNIQVTYDDESCRYPIGSTGSFTPIYDVQKYTYTYIPLITGCDVATGSSKSGIPASQIFFVGKPSGSFTCYVVYSTGQSPVGSMGNGNVHAPYTISLNVNGQVATKQIDPTSGSTSGAIGDYAYGIWQGNLVSGISCPASYNYKASYVNGNWRIINDQAYQVYVNKINQMPNLGLFSPSAIDTWITDTRYYANQAKVSTSFGTIDSSSSLSSAIVTVPLSSPIQFPVTTLYVKADTLGIYTPVPNIGITSTDSGCFKTGETGVISAVISNSGSETGTYRAYATCNQPFQATQSASGSLNPGETRTINIPISATATTQTKATCTISVETTGGTKTASANVCVDPQITCTIPYPQKFCGFSGNTEVVYQCSSNGATKSILQNCASNQYCQSGACIDKDVPCTGSSCGNTGKSIWQSIKDFFSTISSLFTLFRWILLVVASVFALLFSRKILSNLLGNNKEGKIGSWVIASLIGIGIAVGLYLILLTPIFWILAIGVLVFYIITKFLPFRILK